MYSDAKTLEEEVVSHTVGRITKWHNTMEKNLVISAKLHMHAYVTSLAIPFLGIYLKITLAKTENAIYTKGHSLHYYL